ncbi:hypothetical protein GCM10010421_59450 [Streptomyces glaucus]|uniref:Secreted protein n=1 Tax=Streptomyces glaucus TaxID=284029 RepID=A0ABP5XQI7_9ACTN
MSGCTRPHDLRRACTRTDPIRFRGAGVGPDGALLGARRRTGRRGGGRRLRVRVDRPGRHHGGGGRRGSSLARAPAVPDAHTARTAPDARTASTASTASTAPDAHTASTARPRTASTARPHAEAPSPEAPAVAHARPHTAVPGTAPHGKAETPGSGAARAPAGGAAAPAGPQPQPQPHAHTRTGPRTRTRTVGDARAEPLPVPGALSAPPRPAAPADRARRTVAARLRPAHHGTRGDRRRRAAPALISGGFPCRNGLF